MTARLRSRAAWSVADLAGRLSEEQRRLNELDAGDRGVSGAFLLSYQHLTPSQQRLFRLLGLIPGADFDPRVAACLVAAPLAGAERDLDELFEAHLIEQTAPDRYRFHDLLRRFAQELAHRPEFQEERGLATGRMLDYYLDGTAQCSALLDLRGLRINLRLHFPPVHGAPVSSHAEALAWCETEQDNLLSAVRFAAAEAWPDHAWQLTNLLWPFLRTRGRHREAIGLLRVALVAADGLGDQRAQAQTLRALGNSHQHLSRYTEAFGYQRRALALFQAVRDRQGEAAVTANLGVLSERLGRYEESLEHYQRALFMHRENGDTWGEAATLTYLGIVHDHLGRYTEALADYQQALALRRKIDDKRGEGAVLTCAGMILERLGRLDDALEHHQQALELMQTAGDRQGEATTLANLGTVHHRTGAHGQALDHLQRSMNLLRVVGDRHSESEILNDLGETHHSLGDADQSLAHHEAARALASELGVRLQQARAHGGIARGVRGRDPDVAREHYQVALTIYTDLGVPQADQIARELADLGSTG